MIHTLDSMRSLHEKQSEDMKLQILGPLSIESDGKSCIPSAQKPRQVIALMLVNANHIVPVYDFIRELWDESPPATAITTLQTYIMQLRGSISQALGMDRDQVARQILITAPVGYMFCVPPGDLDAYSYNQRATAGQRALGEGDYREAARLLAEALDLWHGPLLADVRQGQLLQIEARRLDESKLRTSEQLIDARLHLGYHAQVLEELTFLAAQHPMNENLHGKLMFALYRSGRRSHALRAYADLRAVLINELGLEPCTQVQILHRAILSSDPRLDQPGWQPFPVAAATPESKPEHIVSAAP